MGNFLKLVNEANKHLRKYVYCIPVSEERLADGSIKITYSDGDNTVEEYWLNGEYHRTDGPAIHYNNDSDMDEYRVKGKQLSKSEFMKHFDTD